MARKISVVFVVSLALSAAFSQAAQAGEFHSSSAHTILSGSQSTTHVFTAGEGSWGISCSTVTFSGTTTATTQSETRVVPTFSGCKDTFGRTVHLNFAVGCAIGLIWAPYTPPNVQIPIRVICTGVALWAWYVTNGSGSTVCTVTVGSQEGVGPVGVANLGGTSGIRLGFEINNLKTTTSGGLLNCGIGNGAHSNGSYTGDLILTGKDTGGSAVTISAG